MTHFRHGVLLGATLLGLMATSGASAKEVQVKMLNRGAAGAMVFEPAFVKLAVGDTVRFVPTDPNHNAQSIVGMLPAGAKDFKGGIDQETVVKFTVPGLYGYKCLPHLGMGMVGLVQVGAASNRPEITAATAKLPGMAKTRMTAALGQVR